jgi:hypothetical protein
MQAGTGPTGDAGQANQTGSDRRGSHCRAPARGLIDVGTLGKLEISGGRRRVY